MTYIWIMSNIYIRLRCTVLFFYLYNDHVYRWDTIRKRCKFISLNLHSYYFKVFFQTLICLSIFWTSFISHHNFLLSLNIILLFYYQYSIILLLLIIIISYNRLSSLIINYQLLSLILNKKFIKLTKDIFIS